MSTKYIASNWRLPNQENSSKSDNYGLTFDGSSELINCGTGEIVTGEFTVSMWIKRSLTGGDSTQTFFSKADVNGSRTFACYMTASTGVLQFYVSNTGGILNNKRIATSDTITDENWHHLVFINGGDSGLLKIYIDGSEATLTSSGRTGISNLHSSSIPNIIGDSNVGSNDYSGSISELAVFDYALSSTQVSTLYGSSSLGAGNPMALPTPVAYYPLGDNSASNPLTQPNEAVEDASVFDFSSSFIDCGDSDDFSFTDGSNDLSYSFSAWVNADTLSTDLNQPNTIISKYGTSTNEWWFLIENKKLVIINYDQSNPTIIGRKYDTDLSANTWYHVAATYDGSKNVTGFKLYLDGVRVDDTNYNANTTYGGMQNQVQNVFIGKRDRATRLSYFDGQINNTQIWQAELSSTEIETLYNSGVPLTGTQPQASNLKAWYKLDQSANWEADSSGTWQIPDAVSAYPQSFDFVPNDIITTNIDLASATSCSVSAWVKFDNVSESYQYIFSAGAAGSAGDAISIAKWTGTGEIYTWDGSTSHRTGTNVISNSWNNIVVTHTGTERKVYLNGSLIGTFTSGNLNLNSINVIGSFFNSNYWINGKISNVQIWDSALPATGTDSVETLYNNGVPLTTAIASDNLKAWYKLDNTATFSTNWSIPDASGNGNTGTSLGMTEQNLVNNNVSALNGESSGMTSANLVTSDLTRAIPYGDGYSFNFDAASSDYIDCGDSDTFSFGNGTTDSPFSISAWVNSRTLGAAAETIISKDQSTGREWVLGCWSGDVRIILHDGTAQQKIETTVALSTDTWHHIVVTYDGRGGASAANGLSIYKDGNLASTTNISSGGTYTAMSNTSTPVVIGSYYGSAFFDGKLSNISIFNEELTSTEVMKLYSNGVPQDLTNFTPQPQAWWPLGSNSFWNGSAWTVRDMSTGGSNDGTGQNIGIDAIVGDSPRSSANGVGTNNSIPENLVGTTKWSDNNSWSINMSETARVEDTP